MDRAPTAIWTRLLTRRQREICRLLVAGHSEAAIATQLHRSRHTVHNHIKAIYRTLHVHDRFQLFARCRADADHATAPHAVRAASATMATILEHVPNLVLEVNRAGLIEFVNHVCPSVRTEDVVGHSLLQFVPETQRGDHERALRRVFATGRRQAIESTVLDHRGAPRQYHAVLDPVVEDGRVVHCVLTARDLTELPARTRVTPRRPE